MAQFQIFSNTNVSTKTQFPFLLDVQNHILDSLDTRLVIPLSLLSGFQNKPILKLTPTITINNSNFLILTSQMASVHKKYLGSFVKDIADKRQEIISSIDFLISGF
jgi:toxin CcdB